MKLVLIGDCHQKYNKFLPLCELLLKDPEVHIVQIGDMGFNYLPLEELPVERVRFFPGNHERHPNCLESPYCLGKFGQLPFDEDIFFVSGGFSIDRKYRRLGVSYWYEEELSQYELDVAHSLYCEVKPRILLCHEGPINWARHIGNPDILREFGFNPDTFSTRTSVAIQKMLDAHKPEMVITAHYHKSVDKIFEGVRHITLNELEFTTIS